jgi:ATP-dependent DNA ligase
MLGLKWPLKPMEAKPVDAPPSGDEWQYEPKWDGFRCIAVRDGSVVRLHSKSGQPLARYFPDLVGGLLRLGAKQFALDGEIVIPVGGRLSFDDLLMRIHPAESRVQKLAAEYPAMFVAFDLLANDRGKSMADLPLRERRRRLEDFVAKYFKQQPNLRISPTTSDLKEAQRWFRETGGDLDGIVAKRMDLPYRAGLRDGMQKIKQHRTIDCVVGGFRYASGKRVVGSLLLGLYDEDGLLHHVGFTSGFNAAERGKITDLVKPIIKPPGFTGRAPGGPSRWSTSRSSEWQPLKPTLVLEVTYDHFTGNRFRHGTHLVRWRPDKRPKDCTLDQVVRGGSKMLKLLENGARRPKAKRHARDIS